MLYAIYDWVLKLSSRPNAIWFLIGLSFIESSIFPIPPDVMLIPMVLAAPTRWFKLAFACTIASVLGGLAGYGIGYFAYETIGKPLLQFYAYGGKFSEYQEKYTQYGGWIVFLAGTTMLPFKLVTIASGVVQLDLTQFTLTSLLARGIRFFLVAGLLWWFGPAIRNFIEKRLVLVFTIFCVLLIGGLASVKYFWDTPN
jgi:membrane protein YqaA with SNARE-associated domain